MEPQSPWTVRPPEVAASRGSLFRYLKRNPTESVGRKRCSENPCERGNRALADGAERPVLHLVEQVVEVLGDRAAEGLKGLTERCERVADQIRARPAGEPITDPLVSLADPDARPIRKGKQASRPSSATSSRSPRSRPIPSRAPAGSFLPAGSRPANPGENQLLPDTVSERERLASTHGGALDGGVQTGPHDRRAQDAHAETDLHRGPPAARHEAHPPPPRSLSHRHRSPHLPPQTPLWAPP